MAELTRDNWDLHWDRYADSAEQNPAQLYRRRLVFKALGSPTRLLDIGSGQGDFAREVRAHFPDTQILGLELSEKGVEIARRKIPDGIFLQQDLLQPIVDKDDYRGWASSAVCSEVLEHVDDPTKFLRNVCHFLAPGARLVVTVPAGPMSAFDKHIGHRIHYTKTSLKELAADAGYTVESISAAGFPFMNLYKLLVILRGNRLVEDVARSEQQSSRSLAGLVMAAFRPLFRLNLSNSPLGWQLVAVLRRN